MSLIESLRLVPIVERLATITDVECNAPAGCSEIAQLRDEVRSGQPLPGQEAYREAVCKDLDRWYELGGRPDFTRSRDAFSAPHGGIWLLLFPMRLANVNGPPRWRVDAVWGRTYDFPSVACAALPRLVTARMYAWSVGFGKNSAVVFPEMVLASTPIDGQKWAVFFAAREAGRFAEWAASHRGDLDLPLDMSFPDVEAFALADAVHDRGHSLGPIPFDRRLREKLPLSLEAIEELRSDLEAHALLAKLPIDEGLRDRCSRIFLVDRALRFTETNPGTYDDLAGRALLGWLRYRGAAGGYPLYFDFDACRAVMGGLLDRVNALYRAAAETGDREAFARGAERLLRDLSETSSTAAPSALALAS